MKQFDMEADVSTTTTTTDKSRWKTMVLLLLLLLLNSQAVESGQLTIEQLPHNATVFLGESVSLTCVFSKPTDCNWLKNDHPFKVKPKDGNTYTGHNSSTGQGTRDCSIRISNVTEDDFTKWRCSSYGSKNISSVFSQDIWITKRATPSAPVILFNKRNVSVIELPSPDPPSRMVCKSDMGNPPPQLHWEVDGTRYLGRTETIEIQPNVFINQLHWDRGGGWHVFDKANEVICRANYHGFTNGTFARIQFERHYAPGIMKILVKRVNDSSVTIGSHDVVIFSCVSDGHPPNGQWELWSDEDQTWKLYNNNSHDDGQNTTVTSDRVGKYRCRASNGLNPIDQLIVINSNPVKIGQLKIDGTTVMPSNESVVEAMTTDGRLSRGLGAAEILAIILGGTQFITLVILALFLTRTRKEAFY